MLLVHKPLPISCPSPAHFHRRLSSVPHVSVQATKTPGLLSIIPKQQPQRSSQPQRSQQRMTPLKENQRQNRPPKPTSAKAQPVVLQEVIKPPVVESDKPKSAKLQSKNPSSTPDKSSPGRANQKRSLKDKAYRRKVPFPETIVRRFWYSFEGTQEFFRNARQAISSTSSSILSFRYPAQVEATSHPVSEPPKNPSSNLSDPFLSNPSDSDLSETKSKSTFKSLPPPKLGRPSGKLANRRQQATGAAQTPTKAVPVPRSNKGRTPNAVNVSRSAPVNNVSNRFKPAVLRVHSESNFPICDDMTDIDGEGSRPSTPVQKVPAWERQSIFFDDGPRTAPLSSTAHLGSLSL
jgi:hypothetical protein